MKGIATMSFRMNSNDISTCYTKTISDFIKNLRYEDIPADVILRAELIAIHTIGVTLATKGMPINQKAIVIAQLIGNSSPQATIWTSKKKSSIIGAAFALGTLADALDWEDCSWVGHPSASIIPISFITGEVTKSSGKSIITAIVAAYEISQRIALVVQPDPDWDFMKGWGLTAWQIFAAIVPAAKLFGLSTDQINQALGFGATSCPIPSQLHHITMSDAYHFEHGMRTKEGIMCVMLAKSGVENYMDVFDDTFSWDYHMCSHPNRAWYTKELGELWLTKETLLKHWPANMWVQTPIELADIMHRKHGINAEDIEEIIILPSTDNRMYFSKKGYSSVVQAQFSIPFMVASYFLNPDHPGKEWVTNSMLKSSELLALANRIHSSDDLPADTPGKSFDMFRNGLYPIKKMILHTKNGNILEETMSEHPGHPRNMMDIKQITDRFMIQTSEYDSNARPFKTPY